MICQSNMSAFYATLSLALSRSISFSPLPSRFTKLICRALKGDLFDHLQKDWATSGELFSFVEPRVFAAAKDAGGGRTMTPQRKPILLDLFGKACDGDVIFFRPGTDHAKVAATTRLLKPTRPAAGSPRHNASSATGRSGRMAVSAAGGGPVESRAH